MKKKLLALGAVCILALSMMAGCSAGGDREESSGASAAKAVDSVAIDPDFMKGIEDQGYITVGCKTDVPDLSYYDQDTDTWSGLEVELAYKTAARIFQVDEAQAKDMVKFVGVTVADREQKLRDGDIDLMLATYTITDERAEEFALSDSYYTDYIGVMVRDSGASEDSNSLGSSDIESIADLDGKYIGVPKKATTRKAFMDYIDSMNTIKTSPIFNEYDSYDQLFKALKSKEIDAMSVDISILNGYVDSSTKILDIRFGGQHYGGAALPENREILDYLNQAIAE